MMTFTLKELLQATKGTLLFDFSPIDGKITGVETDNRKIEERNVFFAFPGEKVDGHQFVQSALEAGASGAVVSHVPEIDREKQEGHFCVLVNDTVTAFGDLARWVRSLYSIPVVGITGSVGKTTTKDMMVSVLSQKFKTAGTKGNFNNAIGLPKTIFTFEEDTRAAVLEMGMNHAGEIDYLTKIACPTSAVITNIGEAHIGNLGSKEAILEAKCEILGGLKDGGLFVLNGDDPYLVRLQGDRRVKERNAHLVYVGENKECQYRAEEVDENSEGKLSFTAVTPEGKMHLIVPSVGHHMIYPALCAVAVGMDLGLSADQIADGIALYQPSGMRMETLYPAPDEEIYNDTYNANPQSMKAGLDMLSTRKARRIAVLGGMWELGQYEEKLHRGIGQYVAQLPIDTLITVGQKAEYIADEAIRCGMKDVRICQNQKEAEEVIQDLISSGTSYASSERSKTREKKTVWLFKASRGEAMENLVSYTAELMGRAAKR